MTGETAWCFLEIIKSCSICRDGYYLKKSDKAELVAKTACFIKGDVELEKLCLSCDGSQGLVFEEVIRWTDSIFVARKVSN